MPISHSYEPAIALFVAQRFSGRDLRSAQRGVDGCLLYTSDAADERSSVDLGGRRIIKKKNTQKSGPGPRQ